MRFLISLSVSILMLCTSSLSAGEDRKTSEKVIGTVISGLLGTPQQPSSYTAEEKERLVSLLQSGEYATSRQGEVVDAMVFGIPLTRSEHVYSAKPILPSQAAHYPIEQR